MKVSVIIPVWNRAENTRKLVEELIRQKKEYPETEIICVVNNCTEDMSFLYGYEEIITVESEKGIHNARNKGVDTATGDYISFIDNDDWIPPYYLSVIYEHIPYGYDWYVWQWWSDDTLVEMKTLDINNPLKHQWAPWGYLYKASIFDKVKWGYDGKFSETMIWQIITPNTKGYFIKKPMYRYWFNGNDDSVCHRYNRGEDISQL